MRSLFSLFVLLFLLLSCATTTTSTPAERHTGAMVQTAIGGGFTAAGTLTLAQAGLVAVVDPQDTTTVNALALVALVELGAGGVLLYLGQTAATEALDELVARPVAP